MKLKRKKIQMKRALKNIKASYIITPIVIVIAFVLVYFQIPNQLPLVYSSEDNTASALRSIEDNGEEPFIVTHLETPEQVKAVYMTSWVAGTLKIRDPLIKLIDQTEINSIIIDVKDYTGRISFEVEDPLLKAIGSQEIRIPDVKEFLDDLHRRGIYIIARISVFQDPYMVSLRPDLAVKRESDGGVWKDRKGISWIDVGSKEMWDYIVALGKESYKVGFDELNFDYIRFPSDGDMYDIYYPFSEGKERSIILEGFFSYLAQELRGSGAVLSADLFGMTTTNKDDLNIGQVLEKALPYFDYVSPMVYPSHYPPGFIGYSDPNTAPYEVVKYSMDEAIKRIREVSTTTTPGIDPLNDHLKIRPWLQDFDYGGDYDVAEVKAQIQAVYDSGLTSWMLWSPSNVYTRGALEAVE